jgi:hypothetical protein
MNVNEYLPNLDVEVRFDLMHWNVSIGPEKWPIFGRFLTLFPLKRPARCEKIPPLVTIGDIMDDVTCKSSIEWYDELVKCGLKFLEIFCTGHKELVYKTDVT